MTEELGDVTSSTDVGAENNGPASNETGINEAWNPLLQQLPDAYHNVVTPHLKEWDRECSSDSTALISGTRLTRSLSIRRLIPS